MNKAEAVVEALRSHYGSEAFQVTAEAPFRALVGCILSQRTKDANAAKAATALFSVASTPRQILKLNEAELKQLIRSAGYYNTKVRYIVESSRQIIERFHGETPSTREELMSLPGVGPKTVDIVLSYGFGQPGIAIDTHIHRVSRRLGLAEKKGSPAQVKLQLEGALASSDWGFADGVLLQLGKDFCKPRNPRCSSCPVEKLCEYCERSA